MVHVQKLIDGAKPVDWSSNSLQMALERLAERYRRRSATPGIQVDVAYDEADEEAVKDAFFTVAQLGLDNAVRHAEANAVRLRLRGGDLVSLEICDDGAGFAVGDAVGRESDHRHLGLANMRVRAQEIGATLAMESNEQGGSCIRLVLRRPLRPGAGRQAG